jgi:glucose/arabinose dehydrogenase
VPAAPAAAQTAAPNLQLSTVVSGGFSRIWDLAFSPDGTMFFTERPGRIFVRTEAGAVRQLAADLSDLWASGETGLMGIETDPAFLTNRRLYTCQGTTDGGNTVQVVAWVVDAAYTRAVRVNDPLVGGIDGQLGRHGGCQLRVDLDGFLHVGTGDAARGTNPQDLRSLAGKTLRVNRFTGAAAPGNALAGVPGADARIYTYGHRNVQGLALRPGTSEVWSVEHGTNVQDEVNRLVNGGNYGWDPVPGYNEATPMTDLGKFPSAIPSRWSSGPTIATSGAAFLEGAQWGTWQGYLAVSTQAGQSLRVFPVDAAGNVGAPFAPAPLDHTVGRIRGAELGPDGVLYVTTDNGSNDRILALRATGVDSSGAGATSTGAGRIDLAARRADGSLATRQLTTSWSPYAGAGGATTADPDASSRGGTDVLDLWVRGTDGALWQRTRTGTSWGPWVTLGGGLASAPTAVSWAPDRVDVFARGLDGALWWRSFTGRWNGWVWLGGSLTSEPEVASWSPGRLDVVARGADGAIWHRALTGAGWSAWGSLGGGFTTGPAIGSTGANRLDVFGRGWDGQVWTRRWNGAVWSAWQSLGGSITSSPEAMRPAAGRLELFARGRDGRVWRRSFDGASWAAWGPIP